MSSLLAIGLGQGITLSLLLFLKAIHKRNSAWLIGIFILCISAYISAPLLNELLGEPYGSFLVDPLILLIGPSLYGYIFSLTEPLKYRRLVWHGLAFLLYIPLLAYFFLSVRSHLTSPEGLQRIYTSRWAIALGFIKFLHLSVYIALCFLALKRHRQRIKEVFANLQGLDLTWLRYLLYAFLALSLITILLYALALQHPTQQSLITVLNLSLLSVFLLAIAFYAFRQRTIFDASYSWIQESEAASKRKEFAQGVPKYEKSGLKPEEISAVKLQVGEFLESKGFTNPDLNLGLLAESFGIPPHKLSEVLGKHLQTSFYDLINQHRVEAVKQALTDPKYQNLSILGIAYEFGFNSKSTFNTAFKKFTGQSPSHYRRVTNKYSAP